MQEQKVKHHRVWQVIMSIVLAAFLGGVVNDLYLRYQYMLREPITSWKATFFLVVGYLLLFLLIFTVQIWMPEKLAFLRWVRKKIRWLRWIVVVALGALASAFFIFAAWSEIFSGNFARIFIYLSVYSMMAFLANAEHEKNFSITGCFTALLLFTSVFAFLENCQSVTDYPFQLTWSEGNRLWDYSILYGRNRYDYPANQEIPSLTDVGRQSLWGLIFLIPNVNIFVARLWSALVWTVPYVIFGLILFSRKEKDWGTWLLMGCWSFLFLNQGPIYTPLVVGAILVALSRKVHPVVGLLLVALAGYYCNLSRFTWMFAPAMWAGMTYLTFPHPRIGTGTKKRWYWAIAYVAAGLLGGFILPEGIAFITNLVQNPTVSVSEVAVTTSLSQPLLWSRLLPNSTYAPGILLGLLQAVLPMCVLLVIYEVKFRHKFDIWQKAAIIFGMAAFLGVGIVVSVKIGGGSNLHNLDMFLIGLLFVVGLAWEMGAFSWLTNLNKVQWWSLVVLFSAVFLPVYPALMNVKPLTFPADDIVDETLTSIVENVEKYKSQGKVLFIDNRQLLTFGYVDVPLVAEYEKKVLMNEAMEEDAGYFVPFYEQIMNKDFKLIITEPLPVRYQGDDYEFGNENDAWVKWVAIPLNCYYEGIATHKDTGVVLLIPREKILKEQMCVDFQSWFATLK